MALQTSVEELQAKVGELQMRLKVPPPPSPPPSASPFTTTFILTSTSALTPTPTPTPTSTPTPTLTRWPPRSSAPLPRRGRSSAPPTASAPSKPCWRWRRRPRAYAPHTPTPHHTTPRPRRTPHPTQRRSRHNPALSAPGGVCKPVRWSRAPAPALPQVRSNLEFELLCGREELSAVRQRARQMVHDKDEELEVCRKLLQKEVEGQKQAPSPHPNPQPQIQR